MNTPFTYQPIDQDAVREALLAWDGLNTARQRLAAAQEGWQRAARLCHRFVRRGAKITGRPASEVALGPVHLRYRKWRETEPAPRHLAHMEGRWIVHVQVNEGEDAIRYPLALMVLPQGAWQDLLTIAHKRAQGQPVTVHEAAREHAWHALTVWKQGTPGWEVEEAWMDLLHARDDLKDAEQEWLRVERRVHRLVRRGRATTGRPGWDEELGAVTLRRRKGEWIVHVAVEDYDRNGIDTLRFPLDWLGTRRWWWESALRGVHQKAIAAELVSNGDTVRAARLRGRRIVHEARLDGKEWRTACGRVVGPVDRDDLGFTDDEVGCGVCSRTQVRA